MRIRSRPRLSYANVIASLALFAALGVVSTHTQPGELTIAVAGGAGPVGGEAGQPGFAAWLG